MPISHSFAVIGGVFLLSVSLSAADADQSFEVCGGELAGCRHYDTYVDCENWKKMSTGNVKENLGRTYCLYTDGDTQKVAPYSAVLLYQNGFPACGVTGWRVTCFSPK